MRRRYGVMSLLLTFVLIASSRFVLGGTATADSGWVFDSTATAGGAVTNTNATSWDLGENRAEAGSCLDVKAKIAGTKAGIAGGPEERLTAQCTYTGCVSDSVARGESRISVTGPNASGFYSVTARADAVAVANTDFIFTTEAKAEARYSDPLVLSSVTADFVLGQRVTILAGTTISAAEILEGSQADNANMELVGVSDVSGLSTLYQLAIALSAETPSQLEVTFARTPSSFLTFVDPVTSLPLSDSEIEMRVKSVFSSLSGGHGFTVLADADIFRMEFAIGATGVGMAAIGYDGMNSAQAFEPPGCQKIPTLSSAAIGVLCLLLVSTAFVVIARRGVLP